MKSLPKALPKALPKSLPKEIIDKILSYTYKPQPQSLLTDIESFYHTKELILERYNNNNSNNFQAECWLSNDITSFMNQDQATMDGYTTTHNKMWRRLFKLSAASDDDIYMKTMESNTIPLNDFLIRLGILTPEERQQFISYVP